MKIRNGFVSNSSSSSFVVYAPNTVKAEDFFELLINYFYKHYKNEKIRRYNYNKNKYEVVGRVTKNFIKEEYKKWCNYYCCENNSLNEFKIECSNEDDNFFSNKLQSFLFDFMWNRYDFDELYEKNKQGICLNDFNVECIDGHH